MPKRLNQGSKAVARTVRLELRQWWGTQRPFGWTIEIWVNGEARMPLFRDISQVLRSFSLHPPRPPWGSSRRVETYQHFEFAFGWENEQPTD